MKFYSKFLAYSTNRSEKLSLPINCVRYISTFSEIIDEFQHTDDEISSLEQLLRVKPAITVEDCSDMEDFEGLPDDDMVDGDPNDPRNKLGKILLKLSRVYYRHGEQYPEWFISKQKEICNNRSPSQIRRCLKNWMVTNLSFTLIHSLFILI